MNNVAAIRNGHSRSRGGGLRRAAAATIVAMDLEGKNQNIRGYGS